MHKFFIYKKITWKNKCLRILWSIVWLLLYRPSPRPFHIWRCILLKMFGARIGKNVHPYPSAKIWAPWNLTMGDFSSLGNYVDCYSVDKIVIGSNTTISQYAFLCSASHDYRYIEMPLITSPITIGNNVWITADVYVAPGVCIANGAVVMPKSSVTRDVGPWIVAGGNPAVELRKRIFFSPT